MNAIGIVGNGNVAYHLAMALLKANLPLVQVFVRDEEKGRNLLSSLNSKKVESKQFSDIPSFKGIIFLCISDNGLEDFVKTTRFHTESTIIHTSGAHSINILQKDEPFGVMYPFQSLTKGQTIDFQKVPLLIEGSDTRTLYLISEIANKLSDHVIEMNSENRLRVHLASVFINNFSNNLYHIAANIIQPIGLELSAFEHLMENTAAKAIHIGPKNAQTGPAKRGDQLVMDQHLKLLDNNEDFKQLYLLHSSLIQKLS